MYDDTLTLYFFSQIHPQGKTLKFCRRHKVVTWSPNTNMLLSVHLYYAASFYAEFIGRGCTVIAPGGAQGGTTTIHYCTLYKCTLFNNITQSYNNIHLLSLMGLMVNNIYIAQDSADESFCSSFFFFFAFFFTNQFKIMSHIFQSPMCYDEESKFTE